MAAYIFLGIITISAVAGYIYFVRKDNKESSSSNN